MSHVTDIMLVTMLDDGGKKKEHPNVDLLAEKSSISFVKASDNIGGNKAFQADLFVSAVNHLDIDLFLSVFMKIKWEYPECVQLYLKDEHEDIFTEHRPNSVEVSGTQPTASNTTKAKIEHLLRSAMNHCHKGDLRKGCDLLDECIALLSAIC